MSERTYTIRLNREDYGKLNLPMGKQTESKNTVLLSLIEYGDPTGEGDLQRKNEVAIQARAYSKEEIDKAKGVLDKMKQELESGK